ncbi:MAG: LysR family transcriptional regulator [Verrucomicrobiota bacterium]
MDTRLLKIFCAVADCGSIVGAAQKVHLTPSSVSHTLKALETELNCRLFERVGKKMALNHAGEQLLAQVRSPLAALDSAAEAVKRLGKWGQTRLRLGAPPGLAEHLLPQVFIDLRKHSPLLELHVQTGDTPQLIEALHQNKLDLALGLTPSNPVGLALRPIFRDELMFAFAPGHAWADGRTVTRDEIQKQQFILYPRTSLTTMMVEEHFKRLQINLNAVMEVASTAAIIKLAKLNLGVAIASPWTANGELADGRLRMRPVGSKPLQRRWAVISLASHRMTLAEELFCRSCRSAATAMRLDRDDLPTMKTGKG